MKTVPMKCVVGECMFWGKTKEEWVKHFKKNHPQIDTLTVGKEVIKLK